MNSSTTIIKALIVILSLTITIKLGIPKKIGTSLRSALLTLLTLLTSNCFAQTSCNVALKKSATASGNYSCNCPAVTTPNTAFDGSNTGWNSGNGNSAWIQVDLQQQFSIDSIKLMVSQLPNGNTVHEIYTSPDMTTWTKVDTISRYTSSGDILIRKYKPALLKVRGVKFNTTKSPSWVAWIDIKIYSVTDSVLPVITVTGKTPVCLGDSITLAADTLHKSYLWSTGDTTRAITVKTSGTYTVSTVAGCSNSLPVTVTVSPSLPPVAIFPDSATICKGDSIMLSTVTKSNNNALRFDGVDDYVSMPGLKWTPTIFSVEWWLYPTSYLNYCCNFVIGNGWGTFVFHMENNGGVYIGTDVSTRFTPTEIPTGTVELNKWQHFAFTFNKGVAKFYKNGTLLASKTGMTNPTAWTGFMISSASSTNAIKGDVDEVRIWDVERAQSEIQTSMKTIVSPVSAGLKAYWSMNEDSGTTVTDLTGNGFTGTLTNGTARVIPSTAPVASSFPVTYSWAPAMGLSDTTGNTIVAKPTSTTTYIVTATAACEVTKDTIIVKVNTITPIISGVKNICQGDSTTLTGAGGSKYTWNTGDSIAIINVKPITDSTTYKVVVTDGTCKDSTTVQVITNSIPVPNAGKDTSVCVGGNIKLNATGGTTYAWKPSTGLNDTTIANPIVETQNFVSLPKTIAYIATVANGGCARTDTVAITVHPIPVINAGKDLSITKGDSVQLSVGQINNLSLQWTPSTGLNDSTIANPIVGTQNFVSLPTTITYIVTGTDANKCVNRDTIIITVLAKADSILKKDSCGEFFIPTAFSPNDNLINDILKVRWKCIDKVKETSFSIYDRWGKKVFETDDITKGWNGTFDGKALNTGVFVYYLKATLTTDEVIEQKGNISLIR